jgi:GNAT superfamily N-acetyltransferase
MKKPSRQRTAGTVQSMEIEALNRDLDRFEVETFFKGNISADSGRVPLFSRANDPHRGYRSHILAIKDGTGILAALYAAPPVLEVAQLPKLPRESADAALAEYVMLYAIATKTNQRGKGHARTLLDTLHARVKKTTAKTIYGVCASDSAAFYEATGYTVLPPNTPIHMEWGNNPVAWPIEGDAQWFIKKIE